MSKNITYHKSHKWVDNNDVEHVFTAELNNMGIYYLVNNIPTMQGKISPIRIVQIEKDLQKQVDNKEIKSFELSNPITVNNSSGFWKEVE